MFKNCQTACTLVRTFTLSVFTLSLYSTTLWAQSAHNSHHPEKKATVQTTQAAQTTQDTPIEALDTTVLPPTASENKGMGKGPKGKGNSPKKEGAMGDGKDGGQGGGMEGFGMDKMKLGMQGNLPTPKNIYPTLMATPSLTPEQKIDITRQAGKRITDGLQAMNEGLLLLNNASKLNNFVDMQLATRNITQGVALFESGLSVNRALEAGRTPENIALSWFKKELKLETESAPEHEMSLSFFHYFIMTALVLFLSLVFVLYIKKMRHATTLLQKLVATDNINQPADTVVPEPSHELIPTRKWNGRLQVIRVFQETPDVKTFRLVNANGGAIPFTYEPGQFLPIRVKIGEETVKRTYTIASSPSQRYYCELTIKREEHGKMSRFLHDHLNEGDLIEADNPGGKFTFDGSNANSIVLIAGGVGITPIMSALRFLTDSGWKHPIYFLFACRTPEELIYRKEIEYIIERNSLLMFHCFASDDAGSLSYAEKGYINAEKILQLVPSIKSERVHLCGSPGMMDAVKAMLQELQVPNEQVHYEAFGTGKPKPVVNLDTAKSTDPTITFNKSQKTAPFPECCSLLEVAENVGIEIDNSCRMGSCGMCKTQLISGDVTMECDDALSEQDKSAGIILACQAHAKNDVVVDA